MKRLDTLDWKGIETHEYDYLRHFMEIHNQFPNEEVFLSTSKKYYIYSDLIAKIEKCSNELLYKMIYHSDKSVEISNIYLVDNSIFISFSNITLQKTENFENVKSAEPTIFVVGQIRVLYAGSEMPSYIKEIITSSQESVKILPTVSLISRNEHGFYLSDIILDIEKCTELDMHYGVGFNKFHTKLLNRLLNTNKGISLFHGLPGSGKTFYINRIIYDLAELSSKKIILIPANNVSYLLEPDFNSFLISIIQGDEDYEDDERTSVEGIVFIIEDAEQVLMKRELSGNSQSTSNILNLTDGILNNIFKIQVIATYNTDDENIDTAILRDKRLIAKRNFGKLTLDDSIKLGKHLGIDDINQEMTVAEIYSILDKEDNDILIEYNHNKTEGTIGFS